MAQTTEHGIERTVELAAEQKFNAIAGDVELIQSIDAVPVILEVLSEVTGMRFVAIARVTEDRWMTCAVRDSLDFGLGPGDELKVKETFCDQIVRTGKRVAFNHASADPEFDDHPLPKLYGFESYVSVPITRPDGSCFGTLCALDPEPLSVVTDRNMKLFELFADMVGKQLTVQDDLIDAQASLADEKSEALRREQFVAVLGHDLRNPLAAVKAGVAMLQRRISGKAEADILELIKASAGRMDFLIHSMLDFARARMTSGIPVTLTRNDDLPGLLALTIDEIRAAHPTCRIEARVAIDSPIVCDAQRVAQVASNLLSNARLHGKSNGDIILTASLTGDAFTLEVLNEGTDLSHKLPSELMAGRFEPFSQHAGAEKHNGLGLGLYIASEIAKAHGGQLTAEREGTSTKFLFSIPRGVAQTSV